MKRGYVVPALCVLSLLFLPVSALAQCDRTVGQRLDTARALVTLEKDNYASRINYWATDIEYKEPILTNNGRAEMLEYLDAVFGGTAYGFPDDRAVTIEDELTEIDGDTGDWVYTAATHWTGTFNHNYFSQSGMSIVKFRAGEGCPYYHRDYWTEADSWYQVPAWNSDVAFMRGVYIGLFGLMGRCFDDDQDGYTKYPEAGGCPNPGLDCNDFVPGINPGAEESIAAGNCADGVDNDCDDSIDGADPGCSS